MTRCRTCSRYVGGLVGEAVGGLVGGGLVVVGVVVVVW